MASPDTAKPATAHQAANGLRDFDQLGRQINPIHTASPAPAQGASRVLVQIPRGQRDVDRLTLQVVNGQPLFDLRRLRPKDGMWLTTPVGMTLKPEAALQVALAILKAQPDAGRVAVKALLVDLGEVSQ